MKVTTSPLKRISMLCCSFLRLASNRSMSWNGWRSRLTSYLSFENTPKQAQLQYSHHRKYDSSVEGTIREKQAYDCDRILWLVLCDLIFGLTQSLLIIPILSISIEHNMMEKGQGRFTVYRVDLASCSTVSAWETLLRVASCHGIGVNPLCNCPNSVHPTYESQKPLSWICTRNHARTRFLGSSGMG